TRLHIVPAYWRPDVGELGDAAAAGWVAAATAVGSTETAYAEHVAVTPDVGYPAADCRIRCAWCRGRARGVGRLSASCRRSMGQQGAEWMLAGAPQRVNVHDF